MQIKNAVRALIPAAAGTGALLSVAVAWAAGPTPPPGPPIEYGQWSVSTGTVIDTACSDLDVTCTQIASEDGFRYEYVETPNGRFTRMILTDPGGLSGDETDLEFSTETYTPLLMRAITSGASALPDGSVAQGLASRQIVRDSAGTMETLAEIQRGFARAVPSFGGVGSSGFLPDSLSDQAWSTKIQQRVYDTSAGGTVTQGADILTYTDLPSGPANSINTDNVRGQIVDIWQDISDSGTGNKQKFDYRVRSGDSGWVFGSCFDPWYPCPPSITNGDGGTPLVLSNGSAVSWSAGDAITGLWIGSNISAFGLTEVSSPGNGTARIVGGDPNADAWQSAAADDLNWPLDPNVPDPFADPASPLSLPGSPRTSAPSFP